MLILGIDPGTATTGYGIIEVNGNGFEAVKWGLIETDKNNDHGRRFINIYTEISKILKDYEPDIIAIEKVFFATNAKTAIRVGQAQGILLYAAARSRTKVREYAPGTIKKVVAGNGRADKKAIQKSVRKVFGAKVRSRVHKKTHFDNAADALAVALCHALKSNKKGVIKNGTV
jgi:crossover junction endodeoxyribonuclease RuvC